MILIQPSPELQVYIRKTFNEDVNTRDRDLDAIKQWLEKQPHLPNSWDERRLMTFLRGCNFSLEKCKRKLDMYFTMRAAIPEFFADRNIKRPEMQEIIKIANVAIMPGLTDDGKRITIASASGTEFETPDIAHFLKMTLMLGDIRLGDEQFGVAGDVYILDASIALPKHFYKISPVIIKKYFICVQEAYPVKIKEVHVVNVTPLVDMIVSSVKPFLKEKLRNRIHIHSNFDSLHKFVPAHMLPEEYGGTAGKIEDYKGQWVKRLEEYTGWFKEQECIKADESKRPGKPTNSEDLFGLDGSFRQLAID